MLRRTCAVLLLVFIFLAGAPGFAHALSHLDPHPQALSAAAKKPA
jgi:hypothetical protein